MNKADLLEELRCELGLLCENTENRTELYDKVIHLLTNKIPHYKSIYLYLTTETSFKYYRHEGEKIAGFKEEVDFGEDFLSIVAARGEISCEFDPLGQQIFIPFYDGNYLLGQIIILTSQFVDPNEIKFMKYIQTILS